MKNINLCIINSKNFAKEFYQKSFYAGDSNMDRINKILADEKYNLYLGKIKAYEKERKFCKHNMKHFLDVARIAYIMCLENEIDVKKDVIYAIALLHDIGRWQQYESKIPHEKASAALSKDILTRCGFSEGEIIIIIDAIDNHRNENSTYSNLNDIIYKSDKLSRACFNCKAESKCNWSEAKKNFTIKY